MTNQYQISNLSTLLEKMTSVDKDFRFMATNDLMTELQNDSIKLDDDSERKVKSDPNMRQFDLTYLNNLIK